MAKEGDKRQFNGRKVAPKSFPQLPALLIPSQAARALAISRHGLVKMAKRGEAPAAIKVGKQWRFVAADLIAWIEKNKKIL